ncbi:hypothetical protein SCAR479_05939 [Seiridium cardinale]|uniref:Carboxylic ester hydrolase n=1 Tax=Seiridium cardinale TaxID=138064 RepID=A0ABR2XUU0_9PEZI
MVPMTMPGMDKKKNSMGSGLRESPVQMHALRLPDDAARTDWKICHGPRDLQHITVVYSPTYIRAAVRNFCDTAIYRGQLNGGGIMTAFHGWNRGVFLAMAAIFDGNASILGVAAYVFSGVSANVYTQFCNQVSKFHGHQPVSWTVSITGDLISDTLPRSQAFAAGTDAEDSSASPYSLYSIDLAYNPTTKGVPCISHSTCLETFGAFASSCGHSGPAGNLMAYRGSSGSGCGLYTYYIAPPADSINERRCYALNFFGTHHMKVQDWALSRLIREDICKPDRPRVKAADNSTWLLNEQLEVNWVPLLWDDYTQCLQNDGIGGNVTVGCVVYEYKTTDQRVNGG